MSLAPSERAIVLSLFGAGIALLLFGTVATFVWRKAGVTRGALFWAGSGAAAHPERYVRPDRVQIVRMLNLTGAALFLLAVVVLLALGSVPRA